MTILPDTLVHTICNKLQHNYHIMHFPRLKYDPALYYLVREVYDLPDTCVSKIHLNSQQQQEQNPPERNFQCCQLFTELFDPVQKKNPAAKEKNSVPQ